MEANNSKIPKLQLDLSSYEEACMLNPDFKSHHSKIHDLTMRCINRLNADRKAGSLSTESVKEISNSFGGLSQEVVKVVLQEKEEIWKNPELFHFVSKYFELSSKTLDFCNSMGECLNRAQFNQLSIELAVKQFDEDKRNGGTGGGEKNLYSRTLNMLEQFEMEEVIFPEKFSELFDCVLENHDSMLVKLKELENKQDKKLKSNMTWKWVCMAILTAVNALIEICKAVLLVLPPPMNSPYLIALNAGLKAMRGYYLCISG